MRKSEKYVCDLLDILVRKEHKTFSREEIFRAVFKGKKFSEQLLYTAYSDLLQYVKTFLAAERMAAEQTSRDLLFLEELESRDEDETFDLEKKAFIRTWEKQPLRHAGKFAELFRLHDAADKKFMKKQKREFDLSLQQKIDALDIFYFSTKLKEACEVINRHNIIGERYNLRFIEEIISFTDSQEELARQPPILVYATIWKMITSQEEMHYYKLREFLSLLPVFPKDEARDIVNYCMNYCIKKINTGAEKYLEEAFELYMFQLDSQLLFHKRFMTQWDYKNIVTVAVRLKKFEWTEEFIHQYKERIEPAFRENAFNYNLANLYYEKGAYRNSIRILSEVEFSDVYYALNAKSLLLKIYYEQKEYDLLIGFADSFRTYLLRSGKISPYQQSVHLNLVKHVKKAAEIRLSHYSQERIGREKTKWLEKFSGDAGIANIGWVKSIWEGL